MGNHKYLRRVIQKMLAEKYAEHGPGVEYILSEENVPNTDETTAITAIGDPVEDTELNTMIKNVPMGKKGAKSTAATSKKSTKVAPAQS